MRKPKARKKRCICGSPDLRYGSTFLFKTEVTCGACGRNWLEGRGSAARKRYEREVLS